ncbi:HAD hydrolase family protein [Georgenia sp. Z1491]|uniref:HAD hydrolase family protein n=1 Tax=Georgenia sp. Z1491 TaxID=3416707 RepID=UPI003CF9D95D
MTPRDDEALVATPAGDHAILDAGADTLPVEQDQAGGTRTDGETRADGVTRADGGSDLGPAGATVVDEEADADLVDGEEDLDGTDLDVDEADLEPDAHEAGPADPDLENGTDVPDEAPDDDPAVGGERRPGGRTAPAVGAALTRAASWARSVVRRRPRPHPLVEAVSALPEAGPELLVALDIDGTILHHDTTLSPRVAESVAALQDTGTHVMLATGRSVFATVPVARQLRLNSRYAISSNGAVTVRLDEDAPDGYELDHVVTFDPEPALRALHRAIPDGVFAVEDVGTGFRLSSPFPPGELGGEWELVDFEDLCSREVTRLTVRAAHLDAQTFQEAVHSAGMQSVTYAIGWSSWVDVAPEGISKATALERVRDLLEVETTATVGAGDGSNDVEMLSWAGLGVAMGGARAEVKSYARAEVGPVEADGLADLLDLLARPRRSSR